MKISKVSLMWIIGLVLLVGTMALTSAELITFDNVKSYDVETQTVTVKNLFGLGTTYAEVELKTPLIYEVGLGYQKVAEFEVRGFADYSKMFKNMEFYNVRDNLNEVEIVFDYKKKVSYNIDVDDYSCSLKDLGNKTLTEVCIVSGSHLEERFRWEDIITEDIKENEVMIIGLFTTTYEGQNVEWIPNLFGVRINEWAVWTAGLNTGLMAYYKMDEGAGATDTISDELGNFDGTNAGADNTTGLILSGYNGNGTSEYISLDTPIFDTSATNTPYSFFAWIKTSDTNANFGLISQLSGGAVENRFNFGFDSVATGKLRYFKGGVTLSFLSSGAVNSGVWKHVGFVAQANGTTTLYINASADGTTDADARAWENSNTLLMTQQSGFGYFIGDMDEVGIWNRSLTSTEVTQLYNSGAGMTFGGFDDDSPTSTLNSPADLVTVYNPSVTFNATGTDNFLVQNMSLIVNDTWVSTNSSPFNNTLTSFPYTLTSASLWNWSVETCDNASQCTNATFRSITYATNINITLNAPPIMSNYSVSTFGLNGTAFDDTSVANVSLILNATYNGTDTSVTNNTLVNFDRALADGFYNWTMEACDGFNNCVNGTTWNFTIDATFPALSTSAPVDPVSYQAINTNLTLNWSINDTHLDACWYEYLGVNTTITCADNTTNINITDSENTTIIVWANDTFGNENPTTVTWSYTFFSSGSSSNAFAYETDDEDYSINLTIPAAVTDISSFLNYNGTTHAATSSCTGTACYITSSLDIPLMDTTNANELNPFNWVITTLTGSTTATLTTDTENQNVSLINFSKCGAPFSTVLFNISKEHDRTALVADFDATFKYYIGDGTVVKTEKTTQSAAASYDYCISPNETYIVSSTIFLDATGFESRNFDFDSKSYDNLSQTVQPLRLANTTYQTVSNIIIEVSNAGLAPMEDVTVNISRYYPATNDYLLVESQITDEFGQIVAKLIESDVKYKFAFYNSAGTLLQTFDKVTIACRATICVVPFVIESTLDDLDRFDTPDLYSSTLSYDNDTYTVTFFWDDQTGSSTTTTLEVIRYNFNQSSTVCLNTSTSSLSTMVCGVGDSTATYKVKVTRDDGSDSFRIASLDFKVGENFSIYGMEGLLWVFILLFTCIGIGAFNPSVGIGLYGVAFMMMGIIGIISMPLSVFFANTILCVLFIWGINK